MERAKASAEQMGDGKAPPKPATLFAPTRPDQVFGCLGPVAKPQTLEPIDEAIAQEVRRRQAQGRY